MANDPVRDARSTAPNPPGGNGRAAYLLASLVLLGSLLLTWLGWQAVAVRERRVAQQEFEAATTDLARQIETRLQLYELMLGGGVAVFESMGLPNTFQWRSYVEGLRLRERHPELTGLGFAIHADPERLQRTMRVWREAGIGRFEVRPRGSRPVYGAILYLEPRTPENIAAIGYDMLSEPIRARAMVSARDTGRITMSGRVRLVQDGGRDVAGLLAYAPVYRAGDRPVSIEARRVSMQGWVYMPFRVAPLVEGVLQRQQARRFKTRIVDANGDHPIELYASPGYGSAAADSSRLTHHVETSAMERRWRIEFVGGEAGLGATRERFLRMALMTGLLAALLLASAVFGLAYTHHRARALALRMTEAYRASEARAQALNRTLEARVETRTRALSEANQELEAFAYGVSHDLRAPLRAMLGFTQAFRRDHAASIAPEASAKLGRILDAGTRMNELIEGLLKLARTRRDPLARAPVDLSATAAELVEELQSSEPARSVRVDIQPGLRADADPALARNLLQNLIGNAWKFTGRTQDARIEFGMEPRGTFFVRDNGAGFDPEYAARLFQPFQRMHGQSEFEGHGIGLATVRRIVQRHGGEVWVEAAVGRGAIFRFTLPTPRPGDP